MSASAEHQEKTAARYSFGLFEADSGSGELRKSGVRLRLKVQPFRVLLCLLDRRAIRRQIRDHAHAFQVHVRANEDGFAVRAGGLHAARPVEQNRGATAWAKRGRLRHTALLAGM